jgi:uncharacterized protein (TIGR03083 family)
MTTEALTPVYTAALFPPLHAQLVALLRGLGAADWQRPTLAGAWRVRDVVAHLLDGDLRKLSFGRDAHAPAAQPPSSFAGVVGLVNELNAGGVRYAQRLSPRVLTDLVEVTGRWVSDFVTALPPHGPAHIAVAWAGEDRSENWMDIGREYTERWHHQMQIREAVGAADLLQPAWLDPILDLSVRAFPRAYAAVAAAAGTAVAFEVGDRAWSVIRTAGGWTVVRGRPADVAASVRADAATAWKLLYNALPEHDARERITIAGDRALAEPLLRARSVMV